MLHKMCNAKSLILYQALESAYLNLSIFPVEEKVKSKF